MKFIDDRRLADTRVTGNKNQFRSAAGYSAVEASEQGVDFRFSPVQCFGNQQPVWYVLFPKAKLIDPAPRFKFIKTAPKIARSSSCCLVALLSRLGEQLHDDCRNCARNTLQPLTWRHRLSCDMAVHQLHRIGNRKGETPGQDLVKRHAESIEVAPRIDRAIHPARLFRGHVGECSGDELGRFGSLALTGKT